MKTRLTLALPLPLALFALLATVACEEPSLSSKAKTVTKDAARTLQKAKHRVDEATCLDSDLECLARKAANRIDEAADATSDAVEELKDTVVTD